MSIYNNYKYKKLKTRVLLP